MKLTFNNLALIRKCSSIFVLLKRITPNASHVEILSSQMWSSEIFLFKNEIQAYIIRCWKYASLPFNGVFIIIRAGISLISETVPHKIWQKI